MSIPVHCAHTRLADPNTLKPNPANPNRLNVYFNFDASKPNGELLVAWETLYGNQKEMSLFTQWKDAGGRADLHYYETDGVNTFVHDEAE